MKQSLALAVFLVYVASHTVQAYLTQIYVKKYSCQSDPELAINPVCEIKLLSRNMRKVRIGLTFVRPTGKVFINIRSFVKTPSNTFIPGFFKTTQNYCELSNRKSQNAVFFYKAIETFSKEAARTMNIIRPCPLTGVFLAEMVQDKNYTANQVIAPPNEYKNVWWFYNEKNQTYYLLNEYVVLRDVSRQS